MYEVKTDENISDDIFLIRLMIASLLRIYNTKKGTFSSSFCVLYSDSNL